MKKNPASVSIVPAPTREDLEKLLWSDPASAEFESDAMSIMLSADGGADEKVAELLRVVGQETNDPYRSGENTVKEELRDLACTAKRGAIMLLHAAWYAERQAKKARKK